VCARLCDTIGGNCTGPTDCSNSTIGVDPICDCVGIPVVPPPSPSAPLAPLDCGCTLFMDLDSFDVGSGVDFDYFARWTPESGPIDTFLGSRSYCDEDKLVDCLQNIEGSDMCADVSTGVPGPSGAPAILKPDGAACEAVPYTGYYNPFFFWNRLTNGTDLCGSDENKVRLVTGHGSTDTGLYKIIPVIGAGSLEYVGYTGGASTSCSLPGVIPDNYTVNQIVNGTPTSTTFSGSDVVDWSEVIYGEWFEAFLIGLIHTDCLDEVRRVQGISDLGVYDLKNQICTAVVYSSDIDLSESGGELTTDGLSGGRLGVFKFVVLDFEIPPGSGNGTVDITNCDPANGIGCGALIGSKVGVDVDDMYLLMWVGVVCAPGSGGYVWEDDLDGIFNEGIECNLPPTCGDAIYTGIDDTLQLVSAEFCLGTGLLIVEVDWDGADKRCDPTVALWVDGGDKGNELSVPIDPDGIRTDCSGVCIFDVGDGFYKSTGGVCTIIVSGLVEDLVDRWILVSSCGLGSQGGGENIWTIDLDPGCP